MAVRPPLVERPPRPGRRIQAAIGHDAWELGVVPEHVQLPGAAGVGTHHVALEAHAVHRSTNARFRTRQVGVGLVVRAADNFQPPGLEKSLHFGAPVRVKIPERLQVIDFGEHKLIAGVDARPLQVRLHQDEPRVLERVALVLRPEQFVPAGGVTGLGVPPNWVIVEMGDHEHPPARLAHNHVGLGRGTLGAGFGHGSDPDHAPGGLVGAHHHRHFDYDAFGQRRLRGIPPGVGQPGIGAGRPCRPAVLARPCRVQEPAPGSRRCQLRPLEGDRGGRPFGRSRHDNPDHLGQFVPARDKTISR